MKTVIKILLNALMLFLPIIIKKVLEKKEIKAIYEKAQEYNDKIQNIVNEIKERD